MSAGAEVAARQAWLGTTVEMHAPCRAAAWYVVWGFRETRPGAPRRA